MCVAGAQERASSPPSGATLHLLLPLPASSTSFFYLSARPTHMCMCTLVFSVRSEPAENARYCYIIIIVIVRGDSRRVPTVCRVRGPCVFRVDRVLPPPGFTPPVGGEEGEEHPAVIVPPSPVEIRRPRGPVRGNRGGPSRSSPRTSERASERAGERSGIAPIPCGQRDRRLCSPPRYVRSIGGQRMTGRSGASSPRPLTASRARGGPPV